MKRRGNTLAIFLVIVIIVGLLFGTGYVWLTTFVGREYDVTVKVANVERSEHLYSHTNVWIEQYISSGEGGREALKYELIGHHEFMPGGIYRIRFKNKMLFNIWKGGFFISGKVISIEWIG